MKDIILQTLKTSLIEYCTKNSIDPNMQINLEVPKRKEHGDFSTNIAFLLGKQIRKNPLTVAEEFIGLINSNIFDKIEIAGNGFINFYLSIGIYHNFLNKVISNPTNWFTNIGKSQKLQVEFVSANPTGPLHIGHGRGAAYGDSIARILSAVGYSVQKEYYINDAGNQMNNLAKSIYSRYMAEVGLTYPFPEDGYKGEYIKDIAKELINIHGSELAKLEETEAVKICFDYGVTNITNGINSDLKQFNVQFDQWFSELSLYTSGEVESCINTLISNGNVYEKDSAFWFKSTAFGDDKDRVIKRSNGEYTYFASDIAYHKNKFDRGFAKVVDVWGADHHGYVNRLKNSVSALGIDSNQLHVSLIQMVGLIKDGEKISMSTRAGEFITLKWLLDEVGTDAARFFYLMKDIDSQFDFDIDLAKKKSSDNPVYYLQYAHARTKSLMRNAVEKGVEVNIGSDISLLSKEDEIEIIKKIYELDTALMVAAQNLQPHRLCFYLQELAALFHAYYYNNQIIIENNNKLTNARISLSHAVAETIKYGLELLGVSAPEKM